MRPTVVVTNWVHPEVLGYLRDYATVIANETREPWPRETLLEHARDADALMTFMPDSVDEEFLAECPRLRIVACALKGYDNFDIHACAKRGVWVTVCPDLLTVPTAELAVGLMISLGRNILPGDRHIRSGEFKGWRPRLYGRGLAQSEVGIYGFGVVGEAIAERLVGFGAKVSYYDPKASDPSRDERLHARPASLETLLSKSDYFVLAVHLMPQTQHFINRDSLARMKRGAFLINPARGSVVDEAAVADALRSGQLGGYAADVFEMEDWARSDRPATVHGGLLSATENTVFTPHLGSAVNSVRIEIAMQAARNIVSVLNGQTPEGAVNQPLR